MWQDFSNWRGTFCLEILKGLQNKRSINSNWKFPYFCRPIWQPLRQRSEVCLTPALWLSGLSHITRLSGSLSSSPSSQKSQSLKERSCGTYHQAVWMYDCWAVYTQVELCKKQWREWEYTVSQIMHLESKTSQTAEVQKHPQEMNKMFAPVAS